MVEYALAYLRTLIPPRLLPCVANCTHTMEKLSTRSRIFRINERRELNSREFRIRGKKDDDKMIFRAIFERTLIIIAIPVDLHRGTQKAESRHREFVYETHGSRNSARARFPCFSTELHRQAGLIQRMTIRAAPLEITALPCDTYR